MNVKIKSALRVAIIYFIFSLAWIFLTDSALLMMLDDMEMYRSLSTIKGIFFITTSSILIFYLIKRELVKLQTAHKDIHNLELYDSLTGLYNRHQFDKLIQTFSPSDYLSVIIVDINGLKLINELYGYSGGDEALRITASLIKDNLPGEAFIARFGGDEFVAGFINLSHNETEIYAQNLQQKVNHMHYKDFNLTASVGYSSNEGNALSLNEVILAAENQMVQNKLLNSDSASNAIMASIKTALFERSDETELHGSRMAEMCESIGEAMDLPHTTINDLKLLAILHDIGKIGIDDAILKKTGTLTKIEYDNMKMHTTIGYKMASTIPQLESIAYPILTHHEWYDGKGYPKQLKNIEIPLIARILSVVDAYDAMTNDRIYRKAVDKKAAISELIKFKGTQFDPDIVDLFIDIIRD